MPIKSLQKLASTISNLKKLGGTAISQRNAKNWNAPGGGYDKWKQGDPAREKALPIGGTVRPSPMSGTAISGASMAMPRSFKKGGVVKKTGMAKVHKGEVVIPSNKVRAKKSKTKQKAVKRAVKALPKAPAQMPQLPQQMPMQQQSSQPSGNDGDEQ